MGARPPLYSPKEVAAMFGYHSVASFTNAVALGNFPKPDTRLPRIVKRSVDAVYWYKSTLDAERKRREASNEIRHRGHKFLTPKPKGDQA